MNVEVAMLVSLVYFVGVPITYVVMRLFYLKSWNSRLRAISILFSLCSFLGLLVFLVLEAYSWLKEGYESEEPVEW